MIYRVENHFVISSGGMWLPGCYATRQAARYAFQFTNEDLYTLQKKICYKGKDITTNDLKELLKPRA